MLLLIASAEAEVLDSSRSNLTALAWSPDGRAIAIGDYHGTVEIRDSTTGDIIRSWATLPHPVGGLAFLQDASALITAAGGLQVWNLSTGELMRTLDCGFVVHGIDLSETGHRLAVVGNGWRESHCSVWDTAAWIEVWGVTEAGDELHLVAITRDGKRVAATGFPDGLRLWNSVGPTEVRPPPSDPVPALLEFDDAGCRMLVLARNGVLTVAALDDSDSVRSLSTPVEETHQPMVYCATWAPEGRTIAAGWRFQHDGIDVRVFDPRTGEEVATLGGCGWVEGLAYSPDGSRLAAIGRATSLVVWDLGEPR